MLACLLKKSYCKGIKKERWSLMMTKFAEQLKKYRLEKQLSQDALAEKLFISRQAISKWENGDATPDLENLVTLAAVLEVTLDELVIGKEPAIKVIKKTEKPMNVWEFLTEESKRPMRKGDLLMLLLVVIVLLGVYFIVIHFS